MTLGRNIVVVLNLRICMVKTNFELDLKTQEQKTNQTSADCSAEFREVEE